MKKEDIENGNKLIAEFMGWFESKYFNTPNKMYKDNLCIRINDMKYHSSWDWLMPIVNKVWIICEEIDGNYAKENNYYKSFYELKFPHLYIYMDIETVYKAVIEFIKWYNNKNDK